MSLVDDLKKYMDENPEDVEAYFGKLAQKEKLLHDRFKSFEEWLETHDFDRYLYLLILKHNDDYIDKCYESGVQPHPNNVLEFLFKYVEYKNNVVEIKELDTPFSNVIWEFNDYYFQIIWGQGCIDRIYNKKDLNLLLQV